MDNQLAEAIKLLKKLHSHGHKAFFVGGFVRDYLLGIPTEDIDIATDATPIQVTAIFPIAKPTGVRYGTVTVPVGDFKYEVTTFRTESGYLDHRHPEMIAFSTELEADLQRRDFTINGMAMTAELEIIDLFRGQEDLKERIVRAIGDPEERFREDALRILRAFRFVAKLGFALSEKTSQALEKSMPLLRKIASERIIGELEKIINYPHAHLALSMMHRHQMGDGIPDLKRGLEAIASKAEFDLDIWEFYALSFHLAEYADIPKKWRFSSKEKRHISKLMQIVRKTQNQPFMRMDLFRFGLEDCLSANRILMAFADVPNHEQLIRNLWDGLPIKATSELDFKAMDIKYLGLVNHERQIGETLDKIIVEVVEGRLDNDQEQIRKYASNELQDLSRRR